MKSVGGALDPVVVWVWVWVCLHSGYMTVLGVASIVTRNQDCAQGSHKQDYR